MTEALTAVVIVVPQHAKFLVGLVENLNRSQPPFDQVVIVASGFGAHKAKVLAAAKRLEARNNLVHFAPLGSAGANRNRGWRLADGHLVCFLDADDVYAAERNAVIARVYEEFDFDLFLHGFMPFRQESESSLTFPTAAEFDISQTVTRAKLETRKARDRDSELKGETESTNILFRNEGDSFAVHHAHLVVRNSLRNDFEFHEVFGVRNEDGVFAQDVLDSGLEVVLSPQVLSGYRLGDRAKPKSSFRNWKLLSHFDHPVSRYPHGLTFSVSNGRTRRLV